MKAVQVGSGHFLVVSSATYRERTGPLRVPLPVSFATREAVASLGEAFADRDSLRRKSPTGVPGEPVPSLPSVSLDEAADEPAGSETVQYRATESIDEEPSFVVGLHAPSVGDGEPTSLESLVGTRALPPGHYRDVPVPIWIGNPFPIVPPERLGERPRTHWTEVELPPDLGGSVSAKITATLWDGRGDDGPGPLSPVTDGWGEPVTSTAPVSFGDTAESSAPELIAGGDPGGR